MSISIGKYIFEGPYKDTDKLRDRPGIYVIICRSGGKNYIIDAGESAKIKTGIETYDIKKICPKKYPGTVTVAVYYTPNLQQSLRIDIEKEIRNYYQLLPKNN